MARQRPTPTLKALRPHEAGVVLEALLKAHPDLLGEAERLAADILDGTTWESVGEDPTYAHSVYALLNKHQQPIPDELLDVACPGWSPR